MIFILVNQKLLDKFIKISNNRSKFINFLSNDKEITLITSFDKCKYNKDDIFVHYLMGPGASPINEQFIVHPKNIKYMFQLLWIEDFQHIDKYDNYMTFVNGVILSVRHKKIKEEYNKRYPKLQICSLDHYLDDKVFKCSNDKVNKKYDIIFYGYIDKQYPFRQRLYKLLKTVKKYKIMWIPHPGYHNLSLVKNLIVEQKLSQLLSQSKLSICTSSKYNIIVKKYFEAALSGCLPCGDLPEDYKDPFGDHMVILSNKMTDSEILDKIDQALVDNDYNIKTKELREKIKEKYNYNVGLCKYKELVKNLHIDFTNTYSHIDIHKV